MFASRRLLWMTSLPVCAAALFLAMTANSEPPPAATSTPSSGASASATASASASPSAAPEDLPLLKGADIPAETSDRPKEKEWASGKRVRPLRDMGGYSWNGKKPCTFTLVREWLRIKCTDRVGATLVAGDKTDVAIFAGGHPFGMDDDWLPAGSRGELLLVMTMRLRRNETRIFSLLGLREAGGYGLATFDTNEAIAVVWRDGREDPYIVVGKP